MMDAVFFYGSIISAMILYGNTLSAIKNIRDNKDTETNLIIGCMCTGIIMYSVIALLAR